MSLPPFSPENIVPPSSVERPPSTPPSTAETPEDAAKRAAEKAAREAQEKREREADANNAERNLDGSNSSPGSSAEKPGAKSNPEAKKGTMDTVIDTASNALTRAAELAGKVGEAISKAFKSMGPAVKKGIYDLAKMMGITWLSEWLEPSVEVESIHAKMREHFEEDKVLATQNDEKLLQKLKTLYKRKLSTEPKDGEEKLTEETYSFEQFYTERIEGMAQEGTDAKNYTLQNLLEYKTQEEKVEADKELTALKEAGAVQEGSIWKITINLGAETGTGMGIVEFTKDVDGDWQWRNNSVTRWLGGERFNTELAGLTPEQIENRKKMNALADSLSVKTKTPETPEGTPPAGAENVSETPDRRKHRYAVGLIEAFNEAAGAEIVGKDNGSWKILMSELAGALHNEKFQDALALETENGGTLEATDTSETDGLADRFVSDKNLVGNFEETLLNDPEGAVRILKGINPYEKKEGFFWSNPPLNEKSRTAILKIQQALTRKLPN